MVGLFVALLLAGYQGGAVGGASTGLGRPSGRPVLAGAGPVLDLSGRSVRSIHVPDHVVALTFDDGPDPTWTPRVLAVLRRRGVPATFFVVGSRVARFPGLVRAELDAGDEVGSHTFSHADRWPDGGASSSCH